MKISFEGTPEELDKLFINTEPGDFTGEFQMSCWWTLGGKAQLNFADYLNKVRKCYTGDYSGYRKCMECFTEKMCKQCDTHIEMPQRIRKRVALDRIPATPA
jgi:hypothetical protein